DGARQAVARGQLRVVAVDHEDDRRSLHQRERVATGLQAEAFGALAGDDCDDALAAGDLDFDLVVDRAAPDRGNLAGELVACTGLHRLRPPGQPLPTCRYHSPLPRSSGPVVEPCADAMSSTAPARR